MHVLRRFFVLALAFESTLFLGRPQDDLPDIDALLDAGQQLIEQHVDADLLRGFQNITDANWEQLQPVLLEIQRQLQGEFTVDLGTLRDLAVAILPVLEKHEEMASYAAWLKPRMDYFEVARELKVLVPPVENGATNLVVTLVQGPADTASPPPPASKPPARLPNPPAATQREVWVKATAKRDLPPAAERYVSRLKPIFAAFGVPEELVWVAEVESSFDREAQSPVGAMGLFQLMSPTAKSQGLAIEPKDERTHPEKSARAAASYLKRLHERFGDWRLALAAYNAGEGRVQRLLDQTRGKSYDDIATKLPAETQMYVPKVEAVIRRREGMALSDLKAP